MDIKKELKEEKLEVIKKDSFWGILIAVVSITGGLFVLYHEDIIAERLDEYLLGVDENIFGWLLLIFGSLKIIGVRMESRHLKAFSIVGLSIIWSMLFTVSVLWSFGIGYPSDAFLTTGLTLAICLRVAYKGIFNGLD